MHKVIITLKKSFKKVKELISQVQAEMAMNVPSGSNVPLNAPQQIKVGKEEGPSLDQRLAALKGI